MTIYEISMMEAAMDGDEVAMKALTDLFEEAGQTQAWNKLKLRLGNDVHEMLAQQRKVALVWDCQDVKDIHDGLTDEQAWEVLRLFGEEADDVVGESAGNAIFGIAANIFEVDDGT